MTLAALETRALCKQFGALKVTNTATTVTKKSSSQSATSGQTASFSITGPYASDNYTGPTAIQIWRDNIYGSYMFYGTH